MKLSRLWFASLCLGWAAGTVPARPADVPTQPSRVYVRGRQLMVQKRLPDGSLDIARPYVMKGVNWQPATSAPPTGPDPQNPSQTIAYGCFFNRPDVMNYWLKTEFAAHYQTDIPLMQQMGVNTVRVFSDFGSDSKTSQEILDAFYRAGVMVIVTLAESSQDITGGQYLNSAQQLMNHPAVLMWSLGNEWNLNSYFGSYATMNDAMTATQQAAQALKALDSNHP